MPIPRKRVCHHCRVAKTRCDLATPCYRCSRRRLNCHYGDASLWDRPYSPEKPHGGLLGMSHGSDVAMNSEHTGSTDIGGTIGVSIQGHTSPDRTQVSGYIEDNSEPYCFQFTGGPTLPTLKCREVDRFLSGPIEFRDIFDMPNSFNIPAQLGEVARQKTMSPAIGVYQSADPIHDEEDSPLLELVTMYSKEQQSILSSERPKTPKSFLTRQLLWGQVISIPKKIIQGELPPFIYPLCVLDDRLSKTCVVNGVHQCLPESLASCASLVSLFYGRTLKNSRLFWDSLHAEYQDGDEYRLLSALQSVVIYLLLQIQDLQSIREDDFAFLIRTLLDMAQRLRMSSRFIDNIYHKKTPTHREWALNESARRTFHFVYLLGRLLKIITGAKDVEECVGFRMLPLPCPRLLWEYNSNEAWAHKLDRYMPEGLSGMNLTLYHIEIIASSQELDEGLIREVARWCESADEFGTLLWMVVALE